MIEGLTDKIRSKKAKIAVVGLGYVGLPLAVGLAKKGFVVLGIDTDPERVSKIQEGKSYVLDVPSKILKEITETRRLTATSGYEEVDKMDVLVICVPTPLRKSKDPDLSFVISAIQSLSPHIRQGQLIILESTTYPGTTEEVILPLLEAGGLRAGKDFCLCFSPERVDPGNPTYHTENIPKVVGGVTEKCSAIGKLFYQELIQEVITVSSPRVAEMVKLLENTFRGVNIALVNELALMCHRLQIDVWEVIEAAKTKPFGFMPFYPGPGLGGHCLAPEEYIFIKVKGRLETLQIKDFEHRVASKGLGQIFKADGITLINPDDVEILSFDLKTRKPCYQKIRNFFVRKYNGLTVKVRTEDNREITLTDKHPHIIYNGKLNLKFAQDIKKGDKVLLLAKDIRPMTHFAPKIDLIEHIKFLFARKVRVKPARFRWSDYRTELIPYLRKVATNYNYKDFFKNNFLPLEVFLKAEKKLSLKRDEFILCTGRGSSYQEIKAVIKMDQDLWRLIGYYLSEGCLTKENQSVRVRFTFNRNETEYLRDLKYLLDRVGVRYSTYRSKRYLTDCIKVSSELFGYFIKEILDCGIDSYTMKIPSVIFNLPASFKQALLSGLLRGDGSVDIQSGIRTYTKNNHSYRHQSNAASVSYFTSSPVLFQQVVLLSQQLGLIPTIKIKNKYLRFFGSRNLEKLVPLFAGVKKEKLQEYFYKKQRRIKEKSYRLNKNFALVRVKDIVRRPSDGNVYSVEVENTNTFVSSNGIITHNCIPIDPIYLLWKARIHGFEVRFIELATQINSYMPRHVVERTAEILNETQKPLRGSHILVFGVSYKKDVNDVRESPAIEIIKLLKERGAIVSYHDPYVSELKVEEETMRGVPLTDDVLRGTDCVVIVTDHEVDYQPLFEKSKLIFDTRNALRHVKGKGAKVVRL